MSNSRSPDLTVISEIWPRGTYPHLNRPRENNDGGITMKRLISTLLAICLIAALVPTMQTTVQAASSTNYTVTGNYVDDLIGFAVAQQGKTWSDLGSEMIAASGGISYKGAWCGNFVWWCGYKVGLVSDGFYPSNSYFPTAINPALWFCRQGTGTVYVYNDFYNMLLGRSEEGWGDFADRGLLESVDKSFKPQKGDIIIYGKPQTGNKRVTITHTGYIRQDSTDKWIYTVEGNTGSGVKLRTITADFYDSSYLGYPIAYLRPNYPESSSTAQTNVVQIVSNGTYMLAPQCAPDSRLDVRNASKANGGNIQIHQQNYHVAQQFVFHHVGGGYYKITAKVSGKMVDVQGGETASGTNVWQYQYNGTDAQLWKLEDAGDGYFYIVPKLNTALCLDVASASSKNGTNVQVYTKNYSSAQKWKLIRTDGQTADLPRNPVIDTEKTTYTVGETITIIPKADNASHYAMSVWLGAFSTGQRTYVNYNMNGSVSLTFSEPGVYTIRMDAKNGSGYVAIEKTIVVTN